MIVNNKKKTQPVPPSNSKLINNKSPFYKYKDIINKSIPCLQTLEGTNIKPHLKVIEESSDINKNQNNGSFNLYLINRVLV